MGMLELKWREAAYKDFEERFELVEIKLPALETVRRSTLKNRPLY